MAPSPWSLPLAVMLIVLGSVFAWSERRTALSLPNISDRLRPFLARRTRRRLRVATLIIMIGVLMACGHWTDPLVNPIRFLIIGVVTTIFSVTLLLYGISDYRASRVRIAEANRRRAAEQIAPITDDLGSD